jgi:ATP synthase protein I
MNPTELQPANDKQKPAGMVSSVIKAESAMQMAMLLPAAIFIGWIAGVGLDHWLHTHWISIAGLIVGVVAGFIKMVTMSMRSLR